MIVFGCGNGGKNAYKWLTRQGKTVEAFLDNDPKLQGKTYCGVPIVAPATYSGTDELVMITAVHGSRSAIKNLVQLEIKNYASYTDYVCRDELSSGELAILELHAKHIHRELELANKPDNEELSLSSIDWVIAEGCTLRCKDCANLMQYFDHPKNEDFVTATKAFDRLYNLTDWIYEVRIIGGDAMVNPRLPDYMRFLRDYEHISDIVIYTNGIAIPKPTLLDELTDKRVSVHITDYNHPKQNISAVEEVFNSVGVLVRTSISTEWQDCAKIRQRNRTPEQLTEVMNECCVKKTPSLKDGKFWRCPLSGSLAALNAIPRELHEYVDMLGDDENDALKRKIEMLMQVPYLKACDFCGGRPLHNDNPIPSAIQVDKPLSYTRYD